MRTTSRSRAARADRGDRRGRAALLDEQTDEWAEGRRYLGLDILVKSRLTLLTDTDPEVTTDTILELSA